MILLPSVWRFCASPKGMFSNFVAPPTVMTFQCGHGQQPQASALRSRLANDLFSQSVFSIALRGLGQIFDAIA